MAKKRNVYKGGPRARDFDLFNAPGSIPFFAITPQLQYAHAVSDAQIRAEYSRLRAIANKRLGRMEGKPEAVGTFGKLPDKFPTVRGMNRAEAVRALADVAQFLTAKRGSISGIKAANKELEKKLKKRGINVPQDQIAKFGSFMNAMKKALGITRGEYGSEQLASIWNELFQKGKISQRDFEKRVKSLMADIEQERTQDQKELQALQRKDARAVNKVLRENPVNTFFDDLALDPRTVTAARKKEIRAADQARAARRRATIKRSRARRR